MRRAARPTIHRARTALLAAAVLFVASKGALGCGTGTPAVAADKDDGKRFSVVYDGNAVWDRTTDLVWERYASRTVHLCKLPHPSSGDLTTVRIEKHPRQHLADHHCPRLRFGEREDWRLATLAELETLLDPGQSPALPADHPFDFHASFLVPDPWVFWWTASDTPSDPPGYTYRVTFSGNGRTVQEPDAAGWGWCVRNGPP